MYHHCLFCQTDLGSNDSVERFPVGRRLAFDAAKGRLWVVCPRCARWNLTPLEERWEAIEQCERLYRGTRLRASTDNVGLARLRDGLEIVRIGSPLRPEFAAWRYSAKFGRRRRDAQLVAGAGAALTVAAGVVAAPVIGPAFALGALSVVAVPGITTALAVIPIVRTLAQLMAGANRFGATAARVRDAVQDVEDAGDAVTYLARSSTKGGWRST